MWVWLYTWMCTCKIRGKASCSGTLRILENKKFSLFLSTINHCKWQRAQNANSIVWKLKYTKTGCNLSYLSVSADHEGVCAIYTSERPVVVFDVPWYVLHFDSIFRPMTTSWTDLHPHSFRDLLVAINSGNEKKKNDFRSGERWSLYCVFRCILRLPDALMFFCDYCWTNLLWKSVCFPRASNYWVR